MKRREISAFRLKIGPQEFALYSGETVVGRSDECAICLDDERLSRVHSKFVIENGQLQIVDLGSRNGAYVNGQRLVGHMSLRAGDIVRMGRVEIAVATVGRKARRSSAVSRTLGGATMVDMSPPGSEETDLLARVIQLDRFDEAEKLLKARVAMLLKSEPPLPVDHMLSKNVLNSMVALADKTMSAAWLHRLFKLHVSCEWWMNDLQQKRVERLIRAIGRMDGDGLQTYVAYWTGRLNGLNEGQRDQLARLRDLASRESQIWLK